MTGQIWHYTCDHSAALIRRSGIVVPHPQPLLGHALSWWSDLGPEHRYEVGLTSETLDCDRMAYRFAPIDMGVLTWWPDAARTLGVSHATRDELEDDRLPAHWWVSLLPVAVTVSGGDR